MKTEIVESLGKLNLTDNSTKCDLKAKDCEKESQMEKLSTTRQPCEGDDDTEEKISNNLPPDKTNDLSGNPTEVDDTLDEISSGVEQLQIRGPNGGKPSVQQFQHIANKQMPSCYGYLPHQQQQTYTMPEMQRGKGRRMDDEDLPPTKFYNPECQTSQAYNIQPYGFYNPLQNPAFPQSQLIIGGSTNKSGGIVTVTSPTKPLENPGFTDLTYGDNFIDTCTGVGQEANNPCQYRPANSLPQMDNCGMSQPQMNIISSIPSTVAYPNPSSTRYSPVVDLSPDFKKQQAYLDSPGHRRRSDPSDSGVESAEERSPYTEPICSPQSNYMSPSSVDSGFERSPQHETFYPENQSQSSVPGGSPPTYPATPSPSTTSGYGSPGMPSMKEPVESFSQDPSCDGSHFIDENLDNLSMALDVIAKDMQQTAEEKKRRQVTKEKKCVQLSEAQNLPNIVNMAPPGNALPQHNTARPQHSTAPQIVTCASNVMATIGQTITTRPMTHVAQTMPPPSVVTTMNPPQMILFPPNQPATTNSPLLLVPMTGHNPVNGPLIIVNSKPTAVPAPTQRRPRPILPRPPTSLPPSAPSAVPSNNSVSSSGSPQSVNSNKSPATAGSSGTKPSPRQQNPQAPMQQTKLLNIARRTVADIPRNGLQRYDDEGDTYLHIAVCKTDRYMVQALLERLRREGLVALIDQGNNKRQTPLYLAVAINQPVMVNMLIQFNADVNTLSQSQSADCHTSEVKAAIHVAAAQGSEYQRTLQELLKAQDISINIVNNLGHTAMHCAIEAHGKPKANSEGPINSIPIIQMLIRRGADASAQDMKSGKTPLMYAIEQRDLTLVQAILGTVEPSKLKNVVKKQAFDGSSCLKIAEGLKDMYNVQMWNQLWNDLQNAASGDMTRIQRRI